MTESKKKVGFWMLKAFLIVVLLLGPGIRGYDDWQIHEYLIGVVAPILLIIFYWKKDDNQSLKIHEKDVQ